MDRAHRLAQRPCDGHGADSQRPGAGLMYRSIRASTRASASSGADALHVSGTLTQRSRARRALSSAASDGDGGNRFEASTCRARASRPVASVSTAGDRACLNGGHRRLQQLHAPCVPIARPQSGQRRIQREHPVAEGQPLTGPRDRLDRGEPPVRTPTVPPGSRSGKALPRRDRPRRGHRRERHPGPDETRPRPAEEIASVRKPSPIRSSTDGSFVSSVSRRSSATAIRWAPVRFRRSTNSKPGFELLRARAGRPRAVDGLAVRGNGLVAAPQLRGNPRERQLGRAVARIGPDDLPQVQLRFFGVRSVLASARPRARRYSLS